MTIERPGRRVRSVASRVDPLMAGRGHQSDAELADHQIRALVDISACG